MHSRTCPQCGGRMAGGALLVKDSNGSHCVAQWLEGEPQKSVWTGVKTKGRTLLPVATFRCERCGLLQNYAEASTIK